MTLEIETYPNKETLANSAAKEFSRHARSAITRHDRFSVALAGGSTPRVLYSLLAGDEYASKLDWARIHLFWGDERCVLPDHPDSNYRMARKILIDRVPIPEVNVHRMQGELAPEEGALAYERLLYRYFSWKTPVFDLVLLGMGEDGHTASLFPGDRSLRERNRWVIAVDHNQPPVPTVPRLTLTLPILNFARKVMFLVAGESKAETVRRILVSGDKLPAGMVKPVSGNLKWMLDEAAGTEVG